MSFVLESKIITVQNSWCFLVVVSNPLPPINHMAMMTDSYLLLCYMRLLGVVR